MIYSRAKEKKVGVRRKAGSSSGGPCRLQVLDVILARISGKISYGQRGCSRVSPVGPQQNALREARIKTLLNDIQLIG